PARSLGVVRTGPAQPGSAAVVRAAPPSRRSRRRSRTGPRGRPVRSERPTTALYRADLCSATAARDNRCCRNEAPLASARAGDGRARAHDRLLRGRGGRLRPAAARGGGARALETTRALMNAVDESLHG